MVKANAAFEFSFRDKVFPPGNYVLACTPVAVGLRNAQGEVVATEVPRSVMFRDALRTPRLVYSTDTSSPVRSQIWPGAAQYGCELAPAKSASLLATQHGEQARCGGRWRKQIRQGGHGDEPNHRTR